MLRWLVILILAVLSTYAFSQETALVTRVIDGDTLQLIDGRIIRLAGIDAPEKSQPMGDLSKQWLEIYTLERRVTLLDLKPSAYNRHSARIEWHNADVNGSLVQRGFAWVDHRYNPLDKWGTYQSTAQSSRLGLWSDPNRIPPWEWRDGVRTSLPSVATTSSQEIPTVTLTQEVPQFPSLVTPIYRTTQPLIYCRDGRCYQLRP